MAGNFLRDKDIVIIAYGEIKNELRSGKTAPELASEAMEEVFRWSGLTNRDIDGLMILTAASGWRSISIPVALLRHSRRRPGAAATGSASTW